MSDVFRPDASLLPLLPARDHPAGCDCRRCDTMFDEVMYRSCNGPKGCGAARGEICRPGCRSAEEGGW